MRTDNYEFQTIFSNEHYSGVLCGYQTGTWFGKVFLSVANFSSPGWPAYIGSTYVHDNKWHFIAITRNATSTDIYIDGKLDLHGSTIPLGYSGFEIACAGAWWDSAGGVAYDFYTGYLDNLHVIGKTLSGSDIRRMYAFQMGWI